MIGGQVGFAGHLHIADGVQLAAQSGVPSDLKDASTPYLGSPAIPVKLFAKAYAVYKKLPDLYLEFERLRKDVESLKKHLNR
jgi:UDP-3-O-[3-hydroxymyristoyl] glucosamine N-acyltransferase